MLGRRPPHAQGPCACGAVLGFVRRPPCGERQGSRIISARASKGVKRDRTGCPPNIDICSTAHALSVWVSARKKITLPKCILTYTLPLPPPPPALGTAPVARVHRAGMPASSKPARQFTCRGRSARARPLAQQYTTHGTCKMLHPSWSAERATRPPAWRATSSPAGARQRLLVILPKRPAPTAFIRTHPRILACTQQRHATHKSPSPRSAHTCTPLPIRPLGSDHLSRIVAPGMRRSRLSGWARPSMELQLLLRS